MSDKKDTLIECPFFIKHNERCVMCEGTIKNTVCVQKFKTESEKRKYEKNVCGVFGGRNCPHYRTVSVLYERDYR